MLWHNEKTEGCGVTMAPFTSPRGLALRRKWRQETNLYCLFLLHSAITSTLATPSALTRHCLATARSRRGSDMPPACHSASLPRRGSAPRQRFGTGAKTAPSTTLAPLLGELAAKPPEGSPDSDYCRLGKDRAGRRTHDTRIHVPLFDY